MNDTPELPALPEATAPSGPDALALVLQKALAEADRPRAETITNAHEQAGKTIGKLTGTVCAAVAARLQQDATAISEGRLDAVEARLASQAVTLDTLFHHLTQFAFRDPLSADDFSSYLKLALKAQAQSTTALVALAEIKAGPRVVVTKQLNAAHQQIVNNGAVDAPARRAPRKASRAQPAFLPEPSPLPDHAQMDTRSPREAAPAHQPVVPVDELHRSAD